MKTSPIPPNDCKIPLKNDREANLKTKLIFLSLFRYCEKRNNLCFDI